MLCLWALRGVGEYTWGWVLFGSPERGGRGMALGYYSDCECIDSREIHGLDRVSDKWENWEDGLSIYCGSSCKCSNKIGGVAPE